MSQRESQHDHGPDGFRPDEHLHGSLDRATLDRLVRCAADGELSSEEAAAYANAKTANPKLDGYEQHERELRGAVNRCMCTGCECPQALRDRIAAMTGAAGTAAPASFNIADARRPFPLVRTVLAAAAAVAIVTVAAIYLQGNQPTLPPGHGGVAMADELPTGVQLAGFMSTEHNRCASHPTSIRKFTERDLEHVPVAFRDVLGEEVTLEALLLGEAEFIAAGHCKVPGKGPSIHLMYEAFDSSGNPVEVSLYIQRCGDKRFEHGKAYAVGADGDAAANIIGWRHNNLVYYLVTGSAETTRTVADKLHAPAVAGAI